jgi:hypothetical protein
LQKRQGVASGFVSPYLLLWMRFDASSCCNLASMTQQTRGKSQRNNTENGLHVVQLLSSLSIHLTVSHTSSSKICFFLPPANSWTSNKHDDEAWSTASSGFWIPLEELSEVKVFWESNHYPSPRLFGCLQIIIKFFFQRGKLSIVT